MTQKHIGAARGAARAGASGDPKATLQFSFSAHAACGGIIFGCLGTFHKIFSLDDSKYSPTTKLILWTKMATN